MTDDPRELLSNYFLTITPDEAEKYLFFLNLLRVGGGYGSMECVYAAGKIKDIFVKTSGMVGKPITPLTKITNDL